MSSSLAVAIPGVMTGREFCRRVDEFAAPYLAREARREVLRWKGVNVEYEENTFRVRYGWEVKSALKDAGFTWSKEQKAWETQDTAIVARCPELVRKAKGEAKEALKSVLRLQVSDSTFQRAEARLAAGDIERVKTALTPRMAQALREGVALLAAADDDRASVRNAEGWSKAHTELGHTLHLTGIRTYTQAALALKLLWPYRGQLPASIVGAAFPVHAPAPQVSQAPNPDVLTMAQAQELVALPVDDVLSDILSSTVAIIGGQAEFNAKVPPFMRTTRTPVARIENRATLMLVEKGKTRKLEVRLAS